MPNESIINQIRQLQREEEEFSLELSSGRIVQVYDPQSLATERYAEHSSVGVLHSNGAFEVIAIEHIVAVQAGVHPEEKARLEKRKAEIAERFQEKK